MFIIFNATALYSKKSFLEPIDLHILLGDMEDHLFVLYVIPEWDPLICW